MEDQNNYENGGGQDETQQRRGYQQYPQRSAASINWRQKDDAPRAEPQQRTRGGRGGAFGSPAGFGHQQRETSNTRLYVGNLLYSATKDDITQFFSSNGFNPNNITMSIDPETGRNPSYCFADFDSAEDASKAINELSGQDLMGRTVRISPGVARRQGSDQSVPRQFNSPRSYGQQQEGQTQGYGGYNRTGYSSYTRESQDQAPGKKLYVGGLPDLGDQTEVEKSMKSLFEQFGLETTYVSRMIAPHESKASEPGDHFYCFVELSKPEDVDVAIENLDQKPSPYSNDGVLRVNKAREQARRQGGAFSAQTGGQTDRQTGGFRERRTEGARDWRTSGQNAE